MAKLVDIGSVDQIPLGEGRNFQLGNVAVAVFRNQAGEVFATQPDCPHKQGPLADGLLGGATLICPLHERSFDLRTGEGPDAGCSLRIYPVEITPSNTIAIGLE